MRGIHLQGIQGRCRNRLLQALDNEANGRLGLARRVKIFEKLKKTLDTICHLTKRSKVVNNTIILLLLLLWQINAPTTLHRQYLDV